MRVMLVANPSASAVTARTRVIIQNALSADHDLVVSETSRRGHAHASGPERRRRRV